VGGILFLLLSSGVTFSTTDHPLLADLFYSASAVLFIGRFLTWEDARQLDKPRRNKSYALAIGSASVVLCGMILGNHKLGASRQAAPGVIQSPSVKRLPETTVENAPKTGVSGTQGPQSPQERFPGKQSEHTKPQEKMSAKGRGDNSGNTISGNSNVVGNNNQVAAPGSKIVNAPNGIAIGDGSIVINPTVNNVSFPLPSVSWVIDGKPPLSSSTRPQVSVKISVDKMFVDAKFAVVCDRPCKAVGGEIILPPEGGIAIPTWGTIPEHPEIAAFVVSQPNPMPSSVGYRAYVESADGLPVKILAVKPLTIGQP